MARCSCLTYQLSSNISLVINANGNKNLIRNVDLDDSRISNASVLSNVSMIDRVDIYHEPVLPRSVQLEIYMVYMDDMNCNNDKAKRNKEYYTRYGFQRQQDLEKDCNAIVTSIIDRVTTHYRVMQHGSVHLGIWMLEDSMIWNME